MKPNRINELYATWEQYPSSDNLEKLFNLVRKRIVTRYCEIEPELHEDVAQGAIFLIWRSLVGDGVAKFSADRGDFASFCAMTARGTRKDMLKHERLTATKDDLLLPLVSDVEGQKKGY